jgi:hypothetical protein
LTDKLTVGINSDLPGDEGKPARRDDGMRISRAGGDVGDVSQTVGDGHESSDELSGQPLPSS